MKGIELFEEMHFIEDIGLFFEQMGMPRMAGRILGVLLISDLRRNPLPRLERNSKPARVR